MSAGGALRRQQGSSSECTALREVATRLSKRIPGEKSGTLSQDSGWDHAVLASEDEVLPEMHSSYARPDRNSLTSPSNDH